MNGMKKMHRNNFAKMTLVSLTLVSFFTLLITAFPCTANAQDTGLLWLVNRENPLCENFHPSDLVNFRGVELRADARDAFIEMLAAMEAEKIYGLKLQSAYRNYSRQSTIFEEKKRGLVAKGNSPDAATEITSKSVQPPGASEHQLGLALDVSINGQLSQSFAETKAGIWVEKNCHKFGFIIRYPQSKTDVTCIIYEPWHLRYVGHPHAQIMKEKSLTLEEYHLYLSKIDMYVVWENDGYFLVSHSNSPPEKINAIFSATSFGENASFIITVNKSPRT